MRLTRNIPLRPTGIARAPRHFELRCSGKGGALPKHLHPRLREVWPRIEQFSSNLSFDPLDPRLVPERMPSYVFVNPKPAMISVPGESPEFVAMDIDNTLINGSLGDAFHIWLETLGALKPPPNPGHNEKSDYLWNCSRRTMQMDGQKDSILMQHARALLDRVIFNPIYQSPLPWVSPTILALWQAHQAKGHVTVLASASNYYVVSAFAERMRSFYAFGTRAHVNQRDEATARLRFPISVHTGKASLVLTYRDHIGAGKWPIHVYTDDPHMDFPLLLLPNAPERACVVNPHENLQRRCTQLGFHVMQFSDATESVPREYVDGLRLQWLRYEAARYKSEASL